MDSLRVALLRLLGWIVKKLYNATLLLRLFVHVLEREASRAAPGAVDTAQQRIDDGAAWVDFCDSLKGLVDYVLVPPLPAANLETDAHGSSGPGQGTAPATGPVTLDALDRREGARYLTRVLRGGLEAFMDCWDPAWPVLRPLPYNVKLGADNPDNLYMYGTVSGGFEYRLYGTRGSVTYLSFGVYSGSRPGQGSSRPAHLDSSRLVTRPDGSFEIFLTPQPRGDNWLRLPPDASRIVVRQTFLNRSAEQQAEVSIERLQPPAPATAPALTAPASTAIITTSPGVVVGASGAASSPLVDAEGREVKPPLSAGQVVSGLAGAAVFIAGSVRQFQSWSRSFASRPNTLFTLDHDVYMTAWADPAIHFFHGYWRVGPREALLIQVTPPACTYWNFQLDNWWMESLDYVAHPETTTNKATASYMPDGSICLVVTHRDPRVACRGPRPDGGREGLRPDGASAGLARKGEGEGGGGGTGGDAGEEERKGEEGQEEGLAALLPPRLLAGVTWVPTAHHAHGTMGLRWVLAEEHPVPRCRVVRLGRPLAEAIAEAMR